MSIQTNVAKNNTINRNRVTFKYCPVKSVVILLSRRF